MERIIYCPSEVNIDEASNLAKNTRLPIQIGESPKTNKIIFDRTKIQVLEIPEIEELFSFGNIEQNFHQCIIYINENYILKNNTKLFINEKLIPSIFEERHRIKYIYFCKEIGVYNAKIIHNNTVLKEFDFVVN